MKKLIFNFINLMILIIIGFNCGQKTPSSPSEQQPTNTPNLITATSTISPTQTPTLIETEQQEPSPTITMTSTSTFESTETITVTSEQSTTAQATVSETVTPDYSPYIGGRVYFPPDITPTYVIGKNLRIYYDTDFDKSNGYVNYYNQYLDSNLINYFMNEGVLYGTVFCPGTYYVYAYIDMNNNLDIDSFDLYGKYPDPIVVPPNRDNINFTLNYIPVSVTITVNLPENSQGKKYFCGFLTDSYYTYDSFKTLLQNNLNTFNDSGINNDGKRYQIILQFNKKYPVNLLAYVDYNNNLQESSYLPDKGDFIKFYGTNSTSMPSSKLFSTDNSLEIEMDLATIDNNVTGTVYLPESVNNKPYAIIASTSRLFPDSSPYTEVFWDTGYATGNSVNYGLYVFLPGLYYITAIIDNDNSGFESLPTQGDYFGIYGKNNIDDWYFPYNFDQNASLPGNNFNINCEEVPFNLGTPTFTPTKTFTSTHTFTNTITLTPTITPTKIIVGTINNCIANKLIDIYVDDDLNPFNGAVRYSYDNSPSGTQYNYIVQYDIPVGEYYIYAIQKNTFREIFQPLKIGYYGSSYPSEPQNKVVITSTSYITTADINLSDIPGEISGTITLPQASNDKNFAVVLDTDLNISNGFVNYFKDKTNGQMSYTYQMKIAFSGNYYIYAFVDEADPFDCFEKDGTPKNPALTNDFYGQLDSDMYNNTTNYSNKNIVLQIKQ